MKKRSNSGEIPSCRNSNELSVSMEKSLGNWRDAIEHVGNHRNKSSSTASCCVGAGARSATTATTTNAEDFAQRLRTYKSDTYFSKPDCVSPLFAARLGWNNTSKDTLTCANPECSASLSINFEHDPPTEAASLAAWNCLCSNYRKQLLTAHIPYCSFRCEAQCWLSQTETDNNTKNTNGVVPSFLLSVVPEMILFENQSSVKVQIQLIYQTILQKSSDFDNYLVQFSNSRTNGSESRKDYSYCVVNPDQVTYFIKEQKQMLNLENQPLSLHLKSLLDEWCSGHSYIATENEGEEDTNSCHNNATTGTLYRTQQSVLLATLGWSLASSNANKKASHKRSNIIVECSCCLSRALVPITINTIGNSDCPTTQDDSCVNETTGATIKRVRVIDTAQNSSTSNSGVNRIFWRTAPPSLSTKPSVKVNNKPMHPLTSHRHFCPYLGGSLLHNRTGWEIIINRMLQWKLEQDQSN